MCAGCRRHTDHVHAQRKGRRLSSDLDGASRRDPRGRLCSNALGLGPGAPHCKVPSISGRSAVTHRTLPDKGSQRNGYSARSARLLGVGRWLLMSELDE